MAPMNQINRSDRDGITDRTLRAIADPHRRAILDALRSADGQSVSALGEALPRLGRHAVLKHIRALEEAELVLTRKIGRSRIVSLNPVPLVELATRWLDEYSAFPGLALQQLREHLHAARPTPRLAVDQDTSPTLEPETGHEPMTPLTELEHPIMSHNTRTVTAAIVLEATPERVWKSITDPDQTSRWFFGGRVRSGFAIGDPIEWVDAAEGILIAGVITAIDPPRRLAHTFRATWSTETAQDPESDYEWLLEPLGPELTRLTLTHHNIPADTATAAQVKDGTTLILSALKTFVETGRTMPGMG